LVPTAYLWTRDVSFRNWIESTINMSFLSITKTFKRITHRRGATSGAPPLTKAPLYGVCRVKTSKFFLIEIRLKTCIMDIYMSIYVLDDI